MFLVTSAVSVPGNFSTTRMSPLPPSTTASPISGWCASTTLATSVSRRRPARVLDRDLAQVLRAGDVVEDVADREPLGRGLDEATGSGHRSLEIADRRGDLRVAGGADDLVERDVLVAQLLRVNLDLDLLVAHAPDGDVRDTLHAHQAGADRPAGDDRLLDRGELVGVETDHHDAARRRQRRQHGGRLRHVREGGTTQLGEAFLHQLATLVDVEALLEHEHDRGEAGCRGRADDVDAFDSVQEVGLERHRDELLDLGGGQTERLGLDLDVRRGELRVDVGRRVRKGRDADGEDRGGEADDQPAQLHRAADEPPDHRASRVIVRAVRVDLRCVMGSPESDVRTTQERSPQGKLVPSARCVCVFLRNSW